MVLTITKKISSRKTRSVMLLRLKPASTLCVLRIAMGHLGRVARITFH